MKSKKNHKKNPQVAIIMGSKTDLKTMKAAAVALSDFNISHTIEIISAHRTPKDMVLFAQYALTNGIKVIIAGAGGAAHLPGMVAALTPLPVIGVPVTVGKLNGLDALLSIAQMPKGVPVATVAIDNAYNAGLLAARMLGLTDENILRHLQNYQKKQQTKVKNMNLFLKSKL